MTGRVTLSVDNKIAVITNQNAQKHNAFDDAMDAQLFEIFDELSQRTDVGAIIWEGDGKSWSSGRDVGSIGTLKVDLSHHELMRRGHEGIQRIWNIDAPIIVAAQGWVLGGSFQRALLCDIRICSTDARFALPETGHGVIPDTGGVAVLYQMCGHGLVSDMVLAGRRLDADEALRYGIVSRVVAPEDLGKVAREMASKVATAPKATIKMARQVISNLARPAQRASMIDELYGQTYLNRSDDAAEMRAARQEEREPNYAGS